MSTATDPTTSLSSSVEKSTRVLLLLGPPGCGKGTQGERLAKQLGIPTISTGEMIRAEIKAGSELGKIAAGVTITGGLLSDELVNQIVESRLSKEDCTAGFLLDGYPRSIDQAKFLGDLLARQNKPQPTVVHIDVPNELLVSRTCMRRYCAVCGSLYNLQSKPPRKEGACDSCGAPLQQRADDCEETVRNRLVAYEKSTAPLINYYSAGDYNRVEGTGLPDEVFEAILSVI